MDDPVTEIFTFVSESVTEGHPDKVCDQISDAILDACLAQDQSSRVACETVISTGLVLLLGEITSCARVDYQLIVRRTLKRIGYDSPDKGLDYRACSIIVAVEQQSPDISGAVEKGKEHLEDVGAGDQGIIFGYATDETESMLPLTIQLAHKLSRALDKGRQDGTFPWLSLQCKAMVAVDYRKNSQLHLCPVRIHAIVVDAPHSVAIESAVATSQILEGIIRREMPADLLDESTQFHISTYTQTGLIHPGITGRRIIVDTYGGWGGHGGGAFSGKDFSKVDRSGAYAARWVAKSILASGIANRALVQLSYAIGVAEPLSIFVETYGTSKLSNTDLVDTVRENFDLRPGVIVNSLALTRPIYEQTARYGHFTDQNYEWEKPILLKVSPSHLQ